MFTHLDQPGWEHCELGAVTRGGVPLGFVGVCGGNRVGVFPPEVGVIFVGVF